MERYNYWVNEVNLYLPSIVGSVITNVSTIQYPMCIDVSAIDISIVHIPRSKSDNTPVTCLSLDSLIINTNYMLTLILPLCDLYV